MAQQDEEKRLQHEILFKQDLDTFKCSDPLCDNTHDVVLDQKCHRGAGSHISYDKKEACLNVHCQVCQRLVARVAVRKGTEN